MPSPSGFRPNVLQMHRIALTREDADDTKVKKQLEQLATMFPEAPRSCNRPGLSNVNLSRDIRLPKDQQMDRESLIGLANIYHADQKLADHLSACLENLSLFPQLSSEGESLLRSAAREMLAEYEDDMRKPKAWAYREARSTDDLTSNLDLVRKLPINVGQQQFVFDPDADLLLQEFATVCLTPNSAEIEMLAMALRLPAVCVLVWCTYKPSVTCYAKANRDTVVQRREAVRRLFVVRNWTAQTSDLGLAIRKQEVLQANGPRLDPDMPPEIRRIV